MLWFKIRNMNNFAKIIFFLNLGINIFAIRIIKFEKKPVVNETFVNRETLSYGSTLLDCYKICSSTGTGCNACRIVSDSGTKSIETGTVADVKTLSYPNETIDVLIQTPKKSI